MSKFSIKDLLNEIPQTGFYLPDEYKENLQNLLKIKFNSFFSQIDFFKIKDNYYFIYGPQQYIQDIWAGIVHKLNDDEFEICYGMTMKQISFPETYKKAAYQILTSNKFKKFPEKAASFSYIELCKKQDSIIFSGNQVSDDGKYLWLEILTRPNLESQGVQAFVWDNKNKKEITQYKNIEDLFGTNENYQDILIGIKPI